MGFSFRQIIRQLTRYFLSERDFRRQIARLESMDSYVLVSTLTSSMSFGALLGFNPSSASKAFCHIQGPTFKFIYHSLCHAIQVVSGLSAIFGLYATIIFSLTILYGKSALGAERDIQYDDFLKSTARARVNGFRCFSFSLGFFSLLTILVLVERVSLRLRSIPALCCASYILFKLYSDWRQLFKSAGSIYRSDDWYESGKSTPLMILFQR